MIGKAGAPKKFIGMLKPVSNANHNTTLFTLMNIGDAGAVSEQIEARCRSHGVL